MESNFEKEQLQKNLSWADKVIDDLRSLFREAIMNKGHINFSFEYGVFQNPPNSFILPPELIPDGNTTITIKVYDPTRRGV